MLKGILPHICFILSLVTLTFLILYRFNPGIFVSAFFQIELLIFCLATCILSAVLVISRRK